MRTRNKSNNSIANSKSSAAIYVIGIAFSALLLSIHSVYLVLVIIFGILPGMVAVLIDQEKQRYISKIVLAFNLIGLIPYVAKIIRSSMSDVVAIDMMIEPMTWMVIYGAAAIGWMVYWFFPEAGQLINTIMINSKVNKLEDELEALCQEWGEEIKH
jgi:hypothetical protein